MTFETPHKLRASDLRNGLDTRRVGQEIVVLPEIDSTNTYALDVVSCVSGRPWDGHVVFAELQTAGRGRLGRSWRVPRGAGLMFTALLRESTARSSPAAYLMSTAIAITDAIAESTDVEPSIRWPNDIFVGNRKLAGILVEIRSVESGTCAVAIGVGVNCLQHADHFSDDIRDKATSLEIESKHPVDRVKVARAILRRLDHFLADVDRIDDQDLSLLWQRRSADINARVNLQHDGRAYAGRIVEVHPRTGLLLQLDTGARREFDPATTTRL